MSDFALPPAIAEDLDRRLKHVPFDRVRREADYWALLDVEREHVRRVSTRHRLSQHDRQLLEHWWLSRISAEIHGTLTKLRERRMALTTAQIRRRPLSPFTPFRTARFQLWFNTVGPGGRTWMGNRYTIIRRHTFRLRWRP
jgi:hypothetical protein